MSLPVLDHSVMLPGGRFHYREWPNPGAQALVLLHGFTGHARSWDSFACAMQANYHVYALDQRGHGDSTWADDYSADAMVEDVQHWVTALGLKQFVLLGLSMGGRNAYQFASQHPEEVERLVIVDIGPEIASAGSTRIVSGVQANDVFATPEAAVAGGRAGNARADEAELQNRTRNNLMLLADGTWTYRYDKALRTNRLPRPDAGDAWAMLPKITAPTLLIRGELSDVLDASVAERMLKEIPDCKFALVPGSGHSIPLESPNGFLEAVRTFL
jgi:pimeloyl-ACP methyl ester carboxylesterase